jgi:molybdopterin converting factor small subunit
MMGNGMRVQIRILPWFSGVLVPGQLMSLLREEELPSGSSLRTLLSVLADRYPRFEDVIYRPRDDTLQATVIMTHNGRLISPSVALDLVLECGDSIALIPAYSGG